MDALGRIFNVIPAASGIHIPLHNAQAVTFVTYEDDGSTILTLKESKQGASEQALNVMDHVWKGPGVGGTWTAVAQTADDQYDLSDDTANDAVVVTINASDLTDLFDCVEMTVDGGICVAIVHDLLSRRTPSNLAKSVV